MAQTHWKKLTNPNYLGVYALEDKKDLILTIKDVKKELIIGADGKKEECIVCYFAENVKPMILNSTNCKTIEKLLATPYIEQWAGAHIQVGAEKVKAFGDVVEALRVRKSIPKDVYAKEILCEGKGCGKRIVGAYGMTAEQLADYTKQQYGFRLCADCAKKLKEKQNEADEG